MLKGELCSHQIRFVVAVTYSPLCGGNAGAIFGRRVKLFIGIVAIYAGRVGSVIDGTTMTALLPLKGTAGRGKRVTTWRLAMATLF